MSGYDQLQERLAQVEFSRYAYNDRKVRNAYWFYNAAAIDADGVVTFTAVSPALEIAHFQLEREKKVKTVFTVKKFKLASGDTLKIHFGMTSNPDKFLKKVEEFISNDEMPEIHDSEGFLKLIPKAYMSNDMVHNAKMRICADDINFEKSKSQGYSDSDINWSVLAFNPVGKDDIVQAIVTMITIHSKKCQVNYPGKHETKIKNKYEMDEFDFIIGLRNSIVEDGIDISTDDTIGLLYSIESLLVRPYNKNRAAKLDFKCPRVDRYDVLERRRSVPYNYDPFDY